MAQQLIRCRAVAEKAAIPTPCRGKPSGAEKEAVDPVRKAATAPSVDPANPKVLPDFAA